MKTLLYLILDKSNLINEKERAKIKRHYFDLCVKAQLTYHEQMVLKEIERYGGAVLMEDHQTIDALLNMGFIKEENRRYVLDI